MTLPPIRQLNVGAASERAHGDVFTCVESHAAELLCQPTEQESTASASAARSSLFDASLDGVSRFLPLCDADSLPPPHLSPPDPVPPNLAPLHLTPHAPVGLVAAGHADCLEDEKAAVRFPPPPSTPPPPLSNKPLPSHPSPPPSHPPGRLDGKPVPVNHAAAAEEAAHWHSDGATRAGRLNNHGMLLEAPAHAPMRFGSSSPPERAAEEAEPADGSPIAGDAAAQLYPAGRHSGGQAPDAPSAPAGFGPDGPLSPDGFRSEYDERASERRKLGLRHAARLQAEEEESRRRTAELAALREARGAAGLAQDATLPPERARQAQRVDGAPGRGGEQEARAAVGEEEPEEAALLDELLAATSGTPTRHHVRGV